MKSTTLYDQPGPAVEFYDLHHAAGIVPQIEGDVAFYVRQARRARGPVLELACGTGRVTIPIARRGIPVTGLDRSPHMLGLARAKAAGLPATFVRGDMRRFDLGRKFRLILIPFRSFQALLTPADQRSSLRCIRRHLAPGGRLIINLFDPRLDLCVDGPSEVISRYRAARDPATGRTSSLRVRERVNDALHQVLRETWEFTVRDRRGRVVERATRHLAIRWTYRYEMQHLLELEGLRPVACYGDFHGGRPKYGAEQIWVVERARG